VGLQTHRDVGEEVLLNLKDVAELQHLKAEAEELLQTGQVVLIIQEVVPITGVEEHP